MRELVRIYKRQFQVYTISSIFIVIGLIISFVVISFGTTVIINLNKQNEITKQYTKKNQTYINLKGKDEINYHQIIDAFKDEENVSLEIDTLYFSVKNNKESTVRKIEVQYFNYDYKFKYPIIEGRQYTLDEVNNGSNVAIVGKDIYQKYVQVINNKKYIQIEKLLYEVIGIIGLDYDPLEFNGSIYIPALSLPVNTYEKINKNKSLEITLFNEYEETYNIYTNIKKKIHDIDNSIDVRGQTVPELSIDVAAMSIQRTKKQLLMYLFSLVNCIIVAGYWINRRRYEIAIRKIFGYTNIEITLFLAKELLAIVGLSFLISIVVQLLFGNIYNSTTHNLWTFNYINILTGLVFVVITTVITVIVPARLTIKMQPVEGIKKR